MHLVWHRADLRTHDHPALQAALERARADRSGVLPLVIVDADIFARPDLTARRQAWFLENVRSLRASYCKLGSDLVVRSGQPCAVLEALLQDLHAANIVVHTAHYIRNYTPFAKQRDAAATELLQARGIEVFTYGGQYTHEPGEVLSQTGTRYSVHGAYVKRWRELPAPVTVKRPKAIPPLSPAVNPGEIPVVESDIPLPRPGEEDAKRRLDWFLRNVESDYAESRQFPEKENGSSRLSYYFNIGVLSPRLAAAKAVSYKWKFELSWWDFFADLLDNNPNILTQEAVPAWRGFPWRDDAAALARWKEGTTGFPIIDAAMRGLNQTGYMHNRVRMATADFLTRHLMVDWRQGEEYFRAQLLDGDRAQNVNNWQWVAGCGLSAKPYFRVGNPVLVSKKCDPDGTYIRRWLPELEHLPDAVIHEPWLFSPAPEKYAAPMVNLKETRLRWLEMAKAHLARAKSNT